MFGERGVEDSRSITSRISVPITATNTPSVILWRLVRLSSTGSGGGVFGDINTPTCSGCAPRPMGPNK